MSRPTPGSTLSRQVSTKDGQASLLRNVHVVAKSGNRKTGRIPVTYRPATTCPGDCPFLPGGTTGGCYGTGRLFASARRYSTSVSVEEATWKVRLGMEPGARLLRDRVVGDVVTPEGTLDRGYIAGIAQVALDNALTAFGYTHAWRRFTLSDLAWLRKSGYVMNCSTETPGAAATALLTRLPVVIVNDDVDEGSMIGDKRVITCPAEVRDDVTCASCGLCAKSDRQVIIRFTTHGTAVAKARLAVEAETAKEAA